MEKEFLFRGACTELLAPFDKNNAIDFGALNCEIDMQLEAGIGSLFVNGLATEVLLTSKEEQISLAEATVKRVAGKVPVMGNIVTNIPATSMELLRAYEAAGVDAICVTQPMVYIYTVDALYRFFSDLAVSTKLPVYVYNARETSNTMSPALVARLVNEYDNIIGYKDSTIDIIHLQTLMASIKEGKHFECMSGSDATIFPTLVIGGCGIISLISAVFPGAIIDLCDAYFAGDSEKAFKLQGYVLDIRTVLKAAPFLAGYKYAAQLIGMPLGGVRAPLSDATESQKEFIKENLVRLGLIK
jgi:4-hydroxy-tetrahydrodipicolinate synthase